MPRVEKTPTSSFSSYYGCYIIAMAAFVFFGIIVWTIYSGVSQDKALDAITVNLPVEPSGPKLNAEEGKALAARLREFGEAARLGKPVSLSLAPAEMNAVIQMAPDSGYGSYKDMVRVRRADPAAGCLVADLCLPLKRLKFWEGKMRYLVGEGVFRIEAGDDGIDARLIDVRVPGRELPGGFVRNLEVWPWLPPYRKKEPLGSVLKNIKKVEVTANGLTMSTTK